MIDFAIPIVAFILLLVLCLNDSGRYERIYRYNGERDNE